MPNDSTYRWSRNRVPSAGRTQRRRDGDPQRRSAPSCGGLAARRPARVRRARDPRRGAEGVARAEPVEDVHAAGPHPRRPEGHHAKPAPFGPRPPSPALEARRAAGQVTGDHGGPARDRARRAAALEADTRRGGHPAEVRDRGADAAGALPAAPHQLLRSRHDRARSLAPSPDQSSLRQEAPRRPDRTSGPDPGRRDGRPDADAGRRRPPGEYRARHRSDHLDDNQHPAGPRTDVSHARDLEWRGVRDHASRPPGPDDRRRAEHHELGGDRPARGREADLRRRPSGVGGHGQHGAPAPEVGHRVGRLRHPPGGRGARDPDALPRRRGPARARAGRSPRGDESDSTLPSGAARRTEASARGWRATGRPPPSTSASRSFPAITARAR
jgi:hypothetical protein